MEVNYAKGELRKRSDIYAIWDAVNDPIVDYLSDNTRTRWGRRRPWLLAGLPFYLLLFALIYAVPGVFRDGIALFWYALIVLFLFEAASTVMNTNYQTLFPELFQGFRERTRASAYSQGHNETEYDYGQTNQEPKQYRLIEFASGNTPTGY